MASTGLESTVEWGQQFVPTQGWETHSVLRGRYPVYYKITDHTIEAVATNYMDRAEKVVATCFLSYETKKGKVFFSDFGSDPPFSGLGKIVLELLKQRAAPKEIVPDGPISGAYTFYAKSGFTGFSVTEDFRESLGEFMEGQKAAISAASENLEDEASRARLKNIQKEVKQREDRGIMSGKLQYKP